MKYPLLSVTGFEVEYMIVDQDTLAVLPLASTLLGSESHPDAADVNRGSVSWSNELVSHLVELKTSSPVACLWDVESDLQHSVDEMNSLLFTHHAMLLPTGAHPFLLPKTDGNLWKGEGARIYEKYANIFDIHHHGWKNVQSVHINIPFDSDATFGVLHAAIRVLLPLLPALAASSPILEGKKSVALDARLFEYKEHQKLLPQTMGSIIPEPIFTEDEYRSTVLQPIEDAIAPHNTDDLLQPDFMNARAAIARFDRSAIEIRIVDSQECLQSDISITEIICAAVSSLVEEKWSSVSSQKNIRTEDLSDILWYTARDAETAILTNEEYLQIFGYPKSECTAHELWLHLLDQIQKKLDEKSATFVHLYAQNGSLARRILQSMDSKFSQQAVRRAFRTLAQCLAQNVPYSA